MSWTIWIRFLSFVTYFWLFFWAHYTSVEIQRHIFIIQRTFCTSRSTKVILKSQTCDIKWWRHKQWLYSAWDHCSVCQGQLFNCHRELFISVQSFIRGLSENENWCFSLWVALPLGKNLWWRRGKGSLIISGDKFTILHRIVAIKMHHKTKVYEWFSKNTGANCNQP